MGEGLELGPRVGRPGGGQKVPVRVVEVGSHRGSLVSGSRTRSGPTGKWQTQEVRAERGGTG